MRRILGLLAVLALVVAFAMPVVTADAAHHEGKAEKAMGKAKEMGKKAMEKVKNPCKPKAANPCNPCNPCKPKAANPCNPCNPCKPKK